MIGREKLHLGRDKGPFRYPQNLRVASPYLSCDTGMPRRELGLEPVPVKDIGSIAWFRQNGPA